MKLSCKDVTHFQALFGTDLEKNAIHCSESNREAKAEVSALFPDFEAPKASASAQLRDDLEQAEFKAKAVTEQTITLIRPSAAAQHSDSVIDEAKQAGFAILAQCQIQLSEEQFGKLYEKHAEQDYYQALKVRRLFLSDFVFEFRMKCCPVHP